MQNTFLPATASGRCLTMNFFTTSTFSGRTQKVDVVTCRWPCRERRKAEGPSKKRWGGSHYFTEHCIVDKSSVYILRLFQLIYRTSFGYVSLETI